MPTMMIDIECEQEKKKMKFVRDVGSILLTINFFVYFQENVK